MHARLINVKNISKIVYDADDVSSYNFLPGHTASVLCKHPDLKSIFFEIANGVCLGLVHINSNCAKS